MGGGTDWTVTVGQVVQGMMMVGDCSIGNEKKQKYRKSKCKCKFTANDFACHGFNYN
jgi:hypothetical protein